MKPIFAVLFFAIILGAAACRKVSEGDSASPLPLVDVKTAIVRPGDVEETIAVTGSTVIRREAQLRSSITGVLMHFSLYNGDNVRAGEIIAEVRSKESQAMVQGADELLRMADSGKQREEAKKAIVLAQRSARTVALRAPFTGILSNKTKNEMEVVSEGDQIATLVDPSSIIFLADVPTSRLSRIRPGERVTIRFATRPGKLYEGSVSRIEPQVNTTDQTARVNIVFAGGPPDVEGSLFGEASIVVGRHTGVLLVPVSALLRNDEANETTVAVVGSDSIARLVRVTAGLRRDSVVEIVSTLLKAGATVITEGHYGLPDSTHVRIVK